MIARSIIEAESRYSKTRIHQCVVSASSFYTLNRSDEEADGEWLVIDVNRMKHYPSLNIFYDTLTKKETQEERRGVIIEKLYNIGFEPSPYNNDLALNKFYSLEGVNARIRVELSRNGITNVFVFDKTLDKTLSSTEFFNPDALVVIVSQLFTKDEIRDLMINKVLK